MTRMKAREKIGQLDEVDLIVGRRVGACVVIADHSAALSAALMFACEGLTKRPEVPLAVRSAARALYDVLLSEVQRGKGGAGG